MWQVIWWIGGAFVLGLVLGSNLGVLLMAALCLAKRTDGEMRVDKGEES